jgi:hypothetical protein
LENGPEAAVLLPGADHSAAEPTDFRLYPVPSRDVVNIELSNYLGKDVFLSIYNHLGQRLFFLEREGLETPLLEIDLQKLRLPAGVYFLSVRSEGRRQTERLLITH